MDVVPVEYRSAGNGEGHHDDEVGEEGEGAEDQVGLGSKPGLDDLHKQNILLKAFGPCNHLVKCSTVALFVATEPIYECTQCKIAVVLLFLLQHFN